MTTDETTERTKKIADLWQELGKEVGLDGLQLDENGACTLVFDGRVPVNSAIMEDAVVLHASLGVAPGDRREAFLEMLLAANLFWLESDAGPRGKDTGCGSTGVISVGQAIDQALAEKSTSKRPTYLTDLAKRWRRFERWLPADKRKAINSLTKVDIRRFLNDCELRPVGERNMLRNLSVLR
jgi:Tir chaperone protein (CesT) family